MEINFILKQNKWKKKKSRLYNYRNLYKNNLFLILYSINHFYTGNNIFKSKLKGYNLFSFYYIDILLQDNLDNLFN